MKMDKFTSNTRTRFMSTPVIRDRGTSNTSAGRQTAVTQSCAACILVITLNCWLSNLYAQTTQNESTRTRFTSNTSAGTLETAQLDARYSILDTRRESRIQNRESRTHFVKMVDFYMRNGKLMYGKLVSEGKNKVTLEHLDGSKILVSTYSKREIDTRTLHTRNVLESEYYLELAEYFVGRTWDFTDDPDDFIQAMRCYEKARQKISATQAQDSEKISQIDDKIKQLQADKQVWIRETKSRAELKKLEFIATIEKRVQELEDKVNANSEQVSAATGRLDNIAADIKDNYQKLQDDVSKIQNDMAQQLRIFQGRIEINRELLYRYRWYPRYVYPPLLRREEAENP